MTGVTSKGHRESVPGGLLWKLAHSEEIEIQTRRDPKSPIHRTTIWIVPTEKGVFIRSGDRKGRWYQEALANRKVTIRVGRRKVAARAQRARTTSVIRIVNAAYRAKYGRRWPDSAKDVIRRSRLGTTLRLSATHLTPIDRADPVAGPASRGRKQNRPSHLRLSLRPAR